MFCGSENAEGENFDPEIREVGGPEKKGRNGRENDLKSYGFVFLTYPAKSDGVPSFFFFSGS